MASLHNSLKIIEQSLITPQPPTTTVAAAALPLTFFDLPWLHTGPVERLFFYPSPHPTSHFLLHHLPSLKSSLSLTLGRYLPLAGRVRPSATSNHSLNIRYIDGDWVPFTVVESEDDFHQLSSYCARDSTRLNVLVPRLARSDDGTESLLAVQITVFPGSGVSVGVAVHHVACDDLSSMQFVKAWAMNCILGAASENCSFEATTPLPLYDRTMIADPKDVYSKIMEDMEGFKLPVPSPAPQPQPCLVFATFTLERHHTEKLKLRALAKGGMFHCSMFVVACAYTWVCLLKAQGRLSDRRCTAHLLFSVECRGRLVPPVPVEYFGNCLRPCFVEVDEDELGGGEGVEVAARAIGRAIEGLEKGVLEGVEGWLQRIVSLAKERPMSVAGSPKYGVYGIDFGWGRPVKVEVVSIEKTPGTISLAEGRDGEGVEIGLVLPKHEMEGFGSIFSEGLKLL